MGMISHYLSIAFRNLAKNRFYSVITIAGLGIGLASVFLIAYYLKVELSYDRFHDGAENIYRISWEDETPQTRTPHPMAQAMVRDFPEVESAVSLTPIWGPGLIRQTFSIRNLQKDIRYDEQNVISVDTTFFKVFSFPLEKGDVNKVLQHPNGILLSVSTAKKYFGDEDPIGKHLSINDDRYLAEVVGVFKDVPAASHFHFDILASYLGEKTRNPGDDFYSWGDFGHYNYIRLKPGADARQLEARLLDWAPKYLPWTPDNVKELKSKKFGFRLQPLTEIHLQSHLRWELEANGNISYIYMMGAAAFLILIIGCINFINLTTAQSAERAKEIGVRKTLGAFRRQLTFQFMGEAGLVTLLSVLVAAFLVELAMPFYQSATGHPISFSYFSLIGLMTAGGLLTGLLAGAYPAWHLSAIKPAAVLKGKYLHSKEGSAFRRGFMVVQFFASMVLISSSVIMFSQLNYIKYKSLGFDQEEVVIVPIKNRQAINPKFEELQTELLRVNGIQAVSATSNIPGRSFNQNAVFPAGQSDERINASEATVDYDFFDVLNIQLAEGRGFLKSNPADKDAFIINETTAKNLFGGHATGKEIEWERDDKTLKGTVIGVVRDFHFQSLHEPIRPLIFRLDPLYNYVMIRVSTKDFDQTLAAIEKTWKKFDDRFGFEFAFMKDQLDQQYSSEQQIARLMILFGGLAALIACFGLLGMAALAFRNQIKEISIRKVLGASLAQLTWLLLRDFNRTILIAIILAIPVAGWVMGLWLENFAFHVEISPWVFAGSAVMLVLIAWGTLTYLTLKIARVNPALTLKSE